MAKNLLSFVLTQYATIIIGGERGFNMRDMRDALSLGTLHHPHLSTSICPQPTCVDKARSPSPLARDVGPIII